MVVADLVNREQEVDEITARSELFIASVGVSMRAQKLTPSLLEESAFSILEDIEAQNPFGGFCGRLGVVGVGAPIERADGEKVRKSERHRR